MAAKKKAATAAKPKKTAAKAVKAKTVKAPKVVAEITENQTIVEQPAAAATPATPKTKKKGASEAEVTALFVELKGKLISTEDAKKQSRQLRWALKSLDLAQQAAVRHFTHL